MSRKNLERARPSMRLLQAVYEEFTAQILRLGALGVRLSHIDSHQHAHTIPWLFPAVKAIQRRFGIRRIRASRNFYRQSENPSALLLAKKRIFNTALKRIYASKVTDVFTDLFTFLAAPQELRLRCSSVEIMLHPGALDHDLETEMVRSDWTHSLPFSVEQTNYYDL